MNSTAFITGLSVGLSLIVAIGAQNAFVLRQGVRGEHVFAVCLTCALSDAVLIALGVSSFHRITEALPAVAPVMRIAGAIFLGWYGLRSLLSALRSTESLAIAGNSGETLKSTLATCLALTWLNPHVYLDTVVLLGAVSSQFPGWGVSFATGAVTASFLFFFSLGYGAAWLRPVFARPSSWRILEGGIAIVMWTIAGRLIMGL